MSSSFSPAFLLGNRHAQTIWGPVFRRGPRPPVVAEVWETPDGDRLDVDLLPERPGRPGVLVLHGMEGSSRAIYVRGMLARIEALGWNGAALNFRTCGPTPARGPRCYHSGETTDAALVAERLIRRWRGSRVGAVGFSLGGNVLLKWLGEIGERSPIEAAIAVSVPFDLATSAAALDGPGLWPAVYRLRFLRTLRRKGLRVARDFPGLLDVAAVRACRTIRAFDDAVTAPLHGFAGAPDYWARSSSAAFLPDIRRPTLLVSAEDDPFIPSSSLPRAAVAANAHLTGWVTPAGGHVGFVAGTPWRPMYAVEAAASEFLQRHLGT